MILFFFSSRRRHTRSLCDWSSDVCSSDLSSACVRSTRKAIVRITRKSIGPPRLEQGLERAGRGIGPGGFEPPYPDPKSGVLPLDEGPGTMKRLNLAKPKASSITLWPDCAGRPFLRHRVLRFSAQRET